MERSPETEQPDAPTPETLPTRDGVLQTLVAVINSDATASIPLTLFVQGLVVSGELVSGRRFFQSLSTSTNTSTDAEPSPDTLAGVFHQVGEEIYGPDVEQHTARTAFIHMNGARVFHPGTSPYQLMACRGVGGWTLSMGGHLGGSPLAMTANNPTG